MPFLFASCAGSSQAITAAAAPTRAKQLRVLRWLLSPEQAGLWPQIDLLQVSHRCQNALHACLLNGGSAEALALLLAFGLGQSTEAITGHGGNTGQAASTSGAGPGGPGASAPSAPGGLLEEGRVPASRRAAWLNTEDASGKTPLDYALATHNWPAAALLVRAGALQVGKGGLPVIESHAARIHVCMHLGAVT